MNPFSEDPKATARIQDAIITAANIFGVTLTDIRIEFPSRYDDQDKMKAKVHWTAKNKNCPDKPAMGGRVWWEDMPDNGVLKLSMLKSAGFSVLISDMPEMSFILRAIEAHSFDQEDLLVACYKMIMVYMMESMIEAKDGKPPRMPTILAVKNRVIDILETKAMPFVRMVHNKMDKDLSQQEYVQ